MTSQLPYKFQASQAVHVAEDVTAPHFKSQVHWASLVPKFFLTPITCSHASLPLDGAARNFFSFFFIYLDTQDH